LINDGIEKDEITIEISKLPEEDDFFIPDYDSGYARNLPRKQPRMTPCEELQRRYGDSDLPDIESETGNVFYYSSEGIFEGKASAEEATDEDARRVTRALKERTRNICEINLQQAGIIGGAALLGLVLIVLIVFCIYKKMKSSNDNPLGNPYSLGNPTTANNGNAYDMPPENDKVTKSRSHFSIRNYLQK